MKALALVLLLAVPCAAQEPVSRPLDIISWGTAAINPAVGIVKAWKSPDPKCQFSRLIVSGSTVGIGFIAQRYIRSPRPCEGLPGCQKGNGGPSTHAWAAQVGAGSWRLQYSIPIGAATPVLRVAAHQHTPWQAGLGMLLGLGGEALSHWAIRCES